MDRVGKIIPLWVDFARVLEYGALPHPYRYQMDWWNRTTNEYSA